MKLLLVSALLFFSSAVAAQQSLPLIQEAMAFFEKGEYQKVIPVAEQAVAATKKEFGETSPFHSGMVLFLAMSHWALFQFDKAEPWFVKHKDLIAMTSGENSLDFIASQNRLAQLYREMGRYNESETLYLKGINLSNSLFGENDTNHAKNLNNLASLYQFTGKYSQAEQLYVKSRDIIKRTAGENSSLFASSINNIATLHSDLGQYEKSKPLLLRVLEIRKSITGENHPDYAEALNNLGYIQASLGQHKEAEVSYTKAKELFRQSVGENHPNYATTLSNLAQLYGLIGEYEKAEQLYHESGNIRKNVLGENHPDYVLSMNNLGAFYDAAGRYDLSEKLFIEAAAKTKKNLGENHPAYITCLNNLAAHYHSRGQYQQSEPLYQQAKEVRKKLLGENHPSFAMSLNNLATLYLEMGQYQKAEPLFLQAKEIWKRSLGENHPDYAMCLNNLAAVYEDMQQYKKAEPLYIQSKDIRKAAFGENHVDYATNLNNLAGLYVRIKQFAKAEALIIQANTTWQKVLKADNPIQALGMNNLAALYRRAQQKLPESERLYLQSIALRKKVLGENHPLTAETENDLGLLYMSMGQFKKAEPYFLGSSRVSTQNMLNTFPVLSEKEKGTYIYDNLFFNDCNNSFLYNYPGAAAAVVNNNLDLQLIFKSLSLTDTRNMLDALRNSKDTDLKSLVSKWQTVKTLLAVQYALPLPRRMKNLVQKEEEAETLEKELNRRSADFRKQQSALQVNTKDVRQQLGDDEIAIEFVSFNYYNKRQTDSIIYAAYLLRKTDSVPVFIPLCEEKQLQKLFESAGKTATLMVNSFYRGSELKSRSSAGALGTDLYKLIWKPLEPYLKGIRKVSYSPAGKLYSIAFHALPVDSNTVLMDRYQLQQYTGTRQVVLRTVENKTVIPSGIVLFGDAIFSMDSLQLVKQRAAPPDSFLSATNYTASSRGGGNSYWPNLPGTAEEVKKIGDLFSQNKISTRIFIQSRASEENLKGLNGRSPQVLHIATHGFFLPEQDQINGSSGKSNVYTLADDPLLRSGLILSGGNYAWSGKTPVEGVEDGIATAYEISQLNLSNTELVVLSACETALGDIKGSEGVFGLQRAFKMAGVKKMIVSLWQVPDKETAELMTTFYIYWMKGKPINDSFTQAQEEMRKKYPPFYWAAFVLVE
ncbi:MAG: tetratricopeptide repeat protein [Bacteroidota bacterium]